MSIVRRTRAREDTGKLLRDLLELWEGGSRLAASVVLQPDGTGRFSVQIEELRNGFLEAKTIPETPRAKAAEESATQCSCCQEGCPICDPDAK